MTQTIRAENISVVLTRPRISENIGAAARAMKNMGFNDLIVVAPEYFKPERVRRLATREGEALIEAMTVAGSLEDALKPFGYVVGTTARLGKQRVMIRSPQQIAEFLIPVSQENRVALVFGPEDRGLSNEDLRLCHALVNIPTADFSSLNLAQAVMIMCWELKKISLKDQAPFTPRLATRHELDGMYADVKEVLVKIDYINHENPDYWMNHLRHFFTRIQIKAKEVSMVRGICRQVNWYSGKCYADGLAAGAAGIKGDRVAKEADE